MYSSWIYGDKVQAKNREQRLGFWPALTFVSLPFVGLQIILGASVEVLSYIISATLVGAYAARVYGQHSLIRFYMYFVVAVFCAIPMVLKTFLLEPVDSNLFVPELTFRIMSLGVLGTAVGLVAVAKLAKGNPWMSPPRTAELRTTSIIVFPFGIAGMLLKGASGALGVIAPILLPLSYLGFVFNLFYVVRTSGRLLSFSTLLMGLVLLAASVATNSKSMMLSVILAVGLVAWHYHKQARLKYLVCGMFLLIALDGYIGPAFQYARAYREDYGYEEVAKQAGKAFIGLLAGDENIREAARVSERHENLSFSGAYEISYVSSQTSILDRLAFVSYIDAVVVGWDGPEDYIGFGFIGHQLKELVPNVLDPGNKDSIATGDYITWHYGMRNYGVRGNITVTMYAELFLAGGYIALIGIAAIVAGLFAYIFERATGDIFRNPLGIFWISSLIFVLAGGGVTTYAYYIIRYLPAILLIVGVCRMIYWRPALPAGVAAREVTRA